MRILVVTAAFAALPAITAAQVRQPRRPVLPAPPIATTELPPQAAVVNHALDYHRARWAIDGYMFAANYTSPTGFGSNTQQTTVGSGTHGDYRLSSHFSATGEVTSSYLFGPITAFSGEAGSRYWAMSRESQLRPFVDLRGVYLRLSDQFDIPGASVGSATPYGYTTYNRYSQGVGALVGAGFERTINNSFSITSGLAAVRASMNTYRLDAAGQLPDHSRYWTTSMRFMLGISYNRTSKLRPGEGAASKSLR